MNTENCNELFFYSLSQSYFVFPRICIVNIDYYTNPWYFDLFRFILFVKFRFVYCVSISFLILAQSSLQLLDKIRPLFRLKLPLWKVVCYHYLRVRLHKQYAITGYTFVFNAHRIYQKKSKPCYIVTHMILLLQFVNLRLSTDINKGACTKLSQKHVKLQSDTGSYREELHKRHINPLERHCSERF